MINDDDGRPIWTRLFAKLHVDVDVDVDVDSLTWYWFKSKSKSKSLYHLIIYQQQINDDKMSKRF